MFILFFFVKVWARLGEDKKMGNHPTFVVQFKAKIGGGLKLAFYDPYAPYRQRKKYNSHSGQQSIPYLLKITAYVLYTI